MSFFKLSRSQSTVIVETHRCISFMWLSRETMSVVFNKKKSKFEQRDEAWMEFSGINSGHYDSGEKSGYILTYFDTIFVSFCSAVMSGFS